MGNFFGAFFISVMATASVVQANPFKTIAFPLGGVVVQEIPARNVETFDANDVITITDKGRERTYAIRPGAREVLSYLNTSYNLVILTPERPEVAQALAEKILLAKGQTLARAVVSIKSGVKEFDLSLVQKNYSEILFLRPSSFSVEPKQLNNTFDMGPAYYAFPSYEQYKALGAEQGKNFPKDEAGWKAENYKWFRFIAVFETAGGNSVADFKSRSAEQVQRTSVDNLITYGKSRVQFVEKAAPAVVVKPTPTPTPIPAPVDDRLVAGWNLGYGRNDDNEQIYVAKCIYRNPQGNYIKEAPADECVKTLPTKTKLVQKRNKDWSCQRVNLDGYYISTEANLDSCLADKNFQGKYLWTISGDKGCDLYSEKNEMIQHADPSKCLGSNNAIVQDKGPGGLGIYVFTLTPEMIGMSAADIIKTLSKGGPTPGQPYRLWDSNPQPEVAGLDLKECDSRGQSMKEDEHEKLLPQCQPDTLYTWSPQVKLDWFKNLMPNNSGSWPKILPRPVFTARSPVATFGYGEIAIRIKLNKGTRFVDSHTYHSCSLSDDPNTVYYRADGSYSDWVICSANVIASWSYDTKEQYDEMIRDRQRVLKVKAKEMAAVNYDFYQGRTNYGGDSDVQTMFGYLDGHSFSEEVFQKRFVDALNDINTGGGGIYYNPNIPDSEKTREKHFATDHPIYFNQQ